MTRFSDDLTIAGSEASAAALDLDHLRRQTLGDRELEREILGLFTRQAGLMLVRLAEARSLEEWQAAAHTLKGSARAVGAWAVARAAEAGEAERGPAASDCLGRAVEEALSAIAAHLDGPAFADPL